MNEKKEPQDAEESGAQERLRHLKKHPARTLNFGKAQVTMNALPDFLNSSSTTGSCKDNMDLSQDFYDLLTEFASAKAEYLLIGGYAVSLHSKPRYTKDLDIWVGQSKENLERVKIALDGFGAPEEAIENLMKSGPEEIIWFGSPPARVDIMKTIPGLEFEAAYSRRMNIPIADTVASLISIQDLIAAKKASGRKQDLIDVDELAKV